MAEAGLLLNSQGVFEWSQSILDFSLSLAKIYPKFVKKIISESKKTNKSWSIFNFYYYIYILYIFNIIYAWITFNNIIVLMSDIVDIEDILKDKEGDELNQRKEER